MELNNLVKVGKINALQNLNVDYMSLANMTDVFINIKNDYEKILVKEYILNKTNNNDKKLEDSLKLVLLNKSILTKYMNELSTSEIIKLELAILLINNRERIILYHFDKYFMEKDLLYFKKLFRKLADKYNKTIILLDCKIDFLLSFVDRLVIKNKNNDLEIFVNPNFYDNSIIDLVGMPEIVSFVKYANDNGKKIKEYVDIKELIKAIYREV